MANAWFESVAVAQRRAKRILPKYVYDALIAGSEAGLTLDDNQAAFREIGFQPVVADRPNERRMERTVLGMDLSMPVMISPTGVQAVHPDGEVAVARAAAARGTAVGLSSFGSKPMEAIAEANPNFAFQMYWINDRDWISAQMDRARAAGARAVILTLDWSYSHSRDWGSPALPDAIDLKTMIKYAPGVITRPVWLSRFLRAGALPDLTTPNMSVDGSPAPTFFGAYGQWMGTPQPTWDDLAWFAKTWGGACMVKGVMRVDDARRARDAGFTALSVSNHGGNNLDGTPSPLRALPAIADAVGADMDVLLDGGVRRGSDVVKALALGARAVMIGRAYLWGLAANGQAGVENVLDIMRMGIDSALLGMGVSSIDDLRAEQLLIPEGFARPLGAD
jgi:L-lactate dehydrogenase (cytochrome)/glycolate oxidase